MLYLDIELQAELEILADHSLQLSAPNLLTAHNIEKYLKNLELVRMALIGVLINNDVD